MNDINQIRQNAIDNNIPIQRDEAGDYICNYIRTHNVKRILEIGTAVAYSSIKFASLADDIFVKTIECDIFRYEQAFQNIHDSGLEERISVFLGDALKFDFDDTFDLIFIDAAKSQYINYFEKFKHNLAPDGTIICDNLDFHGMVQDLSLTHNYSTKKLIRKLRRFIDFIKYNNEFDTEFLELGDGICVSTRKTEVVQYIVDAFAEKLFSGNPAAVCIMEKLLTDSQMQKISVENSLSETAFLHKDQNGWSMRAFAPGGEIDLCGHAILASASIVFQNFEKEREKLLLHTKKGEISVTQRYGVYEMKFPVFELQDISHDQPTLKKITRALGVQPDQVLLGRDLVCVFEDSCRILEMIPDQKLLLELPGLLCHVTACTQSQENCGHDIVTRSFGPKVGIPEDPVCGSGHAHVVPFWSKKISMSEITAFQASSRGGILHCRVEGKRIYISGRCRLFGQGKIFVDSVE